MVLESYGLHDNNLPLPSQWKDPSLGSMEVSKDFR